VSRRARDERGGAKPEPEEKTRGGNRHVSCEKCLILDVFEWFLFSAVDDQFNLVLLISSAFPAIDLARDKNHESM
jgi:hypothetical protein